MQGIQRFSKHSKAAGEGISYSVIFRQLQPFSGKIPTDIVLNEIVPIDWSSGLFRRAWQITTDVSQLPIGATFDVNQFNRLRLHPMPQCSISWSNGIATSIVLYSNRNQVSACGTKIWFMGYQTASRRHMVLNNALLATYNLSCVAVYQKIADQKRLFLGQFNVTAAKLLHHTMYFLLIRNE